MPATDPVPCFYTGQNYRVERPAKILTRAQAHEHKRQNLGKFIEHGKFFLLFQVVAEKAKRLSDGFLGTGNALPFSKPTTGDPLHYEIPHAGDRSILARHHRRTLYVSPRNQIWPAGGPQFRFA